MAQRITIVDDVDQESDAVGMVEFGFRIIGPEGRTSRQEYAIDLNADNLEELSETLLEWAKFARKPDKASPWLKVPPVTPPPPPPPVAATKPTTTTTEPAPVAQAEPAEPGIPEWQTPPDTPDRERPDWTAMRKDARTWSGVNGFPRTAVHGKVPPAAYVAWKQAMGWTGPIFEEWRAWRDAGDDDVSDVHPGKPGRGKQSTLM